MPSFASLGKFFGRTASEGAAFAAGLAVGPALAPELQDLINETWQLHPSRVPDPGTLANGVAQGQIDQATAATWASYHGINGERFAALVDIANTGPGVPIAFDLWRRGVIGEDAFRRAAKRQGLEPEWIDDLVQVKNVLLDPADIARAIHKSLIPDPGLLAVPQPSGTGKVPAYPVYPIDALAEAAGSGLDRDRLGALVGLQGNPMGAHEAAQAVFRGVIEPVDYDRAIAEGNTRNEWGAAIFEQSRQIPSVTNYVEAFVRGWITEEQMQAGVARHGMTPEDANLEFLIHGRPLSWHQVFIGLRRGGVYNGPTDAIDPAFLKALRESNIRPEWYNLAWAQRYSYPAAFVLRTLVQSGDLTAKEGEQILLFEGWEPKLAATVAAKWAQGTTAAAKEATASDLLTLYDGKRATRADTLAALEALGYPADEAASKVDVVDARRVASAKSAAISDLHTTYKKGDLSDAAATTALEAIGVAEWAVPLIVSAWRDYLTAVGITPKA
jgi:hypothetical protein